MNTKLISVIMLVIFFAVMIGVGIKTRKKARTVDGFVLGGRKAGPWITAFAFGTSYFSAVIFVGYAGQFGWTFGRKRLYRVPDGLEYPWKKNQDHDPAPGCQDDARLLRKAF